MKAYEATLTIDGKWLMTLTAPNIEMALDGLRAEMYNTAKNIKIEVKEIQQKLYFEQKK